MAALSKKTIKAGATKLLRSVNQYNKRSQPDWAASNRCRNAAAQAFGYAFENKLPKAREKYAEAKQVCAPLKGRWPTNLAGARKRRAKKGNR